MKPLKVGSYVLLKDMFLPSRDWPAMNSFYEIPGKILVLKNQESDAVVHWENGASNRYGTESLNPMSDEDYSNKIYIDTTLGRALYKLSEFCVIPDDGLIAHNAVLFDNVSYIVNASGKARIYINPDYNLSAPLSPVKLIIELKNNLTYKSIW